MLRVVAVFAAMLQGIGVELPWLTRFLLATYFWLLPLFFFALVAFVILKEFSARELRRKFVLTTTVFLRTFVTPGLAILIVYLPLFVVAKN